MGANLSGRKPSLADQMEKRVVTAKIAYMMF
jgi:hypothetical protein